MSGIALIVIDVQRGFNDPLWGHRNNPEAEANIARLISGWRASELPVFHIQHFSEELESPLNPKSGDVRFKEEATPLEREEVITKHVNSAFIGTDLEAKLRSSNISSVAIVGLTTNHCVETTARMSGNLGFDTYFVSDATATFDRIGLGGTLHRAEDIQAMTLSNLNGEFATVVDTDEALEMISR